MNWTINVWLLWALVIFAVINTSLNLKDRRKRLMEQRRASVQDYRAWIASTDAVTDEER